MLSVAAAYRLEKLTKKTRKEKKKKHVSLRVATFLALASVLSSKPPLPVNKLPSQYWCMLGTCFTYPRGNLSYTCQPSGGPSTIACKCAWDRKTARISRAYGCRISLEASRANLINMIQRWLAIMTHRLANEAAAPVHLTLRNPSASLCIYTKHFWIYTKQLFVCYFASHIISTC